MNTAEEIQALKTQLSAAQTELAAATERTYALKLEVARLEGYCDAMRIKLADTKERIAQ